MFIPQNRSKGFTLAELLIALAILGVIATFTIPKVLSNQQDGTKTAIAKEVMAALSAALQDARHQGTLTNTMTGASLTQYINYAAIVPNGTILDDRPNHTTTTQTCTANNCIRLHNGAILTTIVGNPRFVDSISACAPNGYIDFTLDPDGKYTGTPDSLRIRLSYEGRVGTRAYAQCDGSNNSNDDPAWFRI